MNTQPIRVNSEQAGMTDTKACKNLAVSEDHLAASSHDIPAVTKLQDSLPGKKLRQEGDSPPPIDTTLSATESEGFIEDIPRKPRKPRTIPARKDSFIEIEPPSPKPQGIYSQRNSDLSDRSVYTDSDSDGENQTTSEIQRLQQRIQALETRLKQKSLRATTQPPPSRYQTLYEIRPNVYNDSGEDSSSPDSDCDDQYQNWRGNNWHPRQKRSSNAWPREIYMDPPVVMHDGRGIASLHCTRRLDRLNLFLASNPDISFVVFHDYNHDLDPDTREDWRPTPRAKSIYPVSKELKKALRLILEDRPEYKDIFTEYEWTNELSAPYLFIYHSRPELPKIREELSQAARDQLDLLLEFVMKELGDEYDTADSLLQRNEILPQYVQYLIKPGDILVENRNGEYTGYRAQTYPVESLRRPSIMLKQHIHGMSENRDESHHHSPDVVRKWTLSGFTWRFDGTFYGKNKQLKIEMPQNDSSLSEETQLQEAVGDDGTRVAQLKGQPIATLRVFPLRCAPDHMRKMLYHRGEMLWKCRLRRLVSYQAHEPDPTGNGMEEHCIIDMRTYQSLHPKEKPDFYVHPSRRACRLSKVDMARDGPPGDEFRLLMPPRVKGYNFWRKKWCDLKVDQISDVIWKQDAFQSLEIDYEAKTLIRALVANYLKTETSWDFIAGKGNGLIFLLHGSPGTGKTHTAESIAEIAEKPLYRVTCNDLGAKAEAVERNLESALDLGRTWGCVMLLDEADIFLEQKSLDDLERHALVSGFLRMVKSYDGIVILTCSRVNTFNETFRSRIHLALHYPALDPYRRSLIWRRFIEQLDSSNDDTNISDVWGLAESLKDEWNADQKHYY